MKNIFQDPQYRALMADHIREVRRDMPFRSLKGGWSISEWNGKVRNGARNMARNIAHFHNVNRGAK